MGTLQDKYSELIIKANLLQISRFNFTHMDRMYLVEWDKNKWTEPILLVNL